MVAAAAAALCTSAQASRIYTFEATSTPLGSFFAESRCNGIAGFEFGCNWLNMTPDRITGRLQLSDAAHAAGGVRRASLVGPSDALEAFEFTVLAPPGSGYESFRFVLGITDPSDRRVATFLSFDTRTLTGFISAADRATGTAVGLDTFRSVTNDWEGAYVDYDEQGCVPRSRVGAPCLFTGRWVEQGSGGTGGGTVPLPGTVPLMALASFGIAVALRRRGA